MLWILIDRFSKNSHETQVWQRHSVGGSAKSNSVKDRTSAPQRCISCSGFWSPFFKVGLFWASLRVWRAWSQPWIRHWPTASAPCSMLARCWILVPLLVRPIFASSERESWCDPWHTKHHMRKGTWFLCSVKVCHGQRLKDRTQSLTGCGSRCWICRNTTFGFVLAPVHFQMSLSIFYGLQILKRCCKLRHHLSSFPTSTAIR